MCASIIVFETRACRVRGKSRLSVVLLQFWKLKVALFFLCAPDFSVAGVDLHQAVHFLSYFKCGTANQCHREQCYEMHLLPLSFEGFRCLLRMRPFLRCFSDENSIEANLLAISVCLWYVNTPRSRQGCGDSATHDTHTPGISVRSSFNQ